MVTITGEDVTCAEALAINESTWVPGVEPAAKDAVTPFGRPVTVSATVPEKPPTSATVMVLVPPPPCGTETVAGAGDNVKPATVMLNGEVTEAAGLSESLTVIEKLEVPGVVGVPVMEPVGVSNCNGVGKLPEVRA